MEVRHVRSQGLHGGDVARVALELGSDPNLIVDFSANINPRGLPSGAIQALLRAAQDNGERLRYPDWRSHPLRSTLAQHLKVPIESVVLGAGASALITDSIRTVRPSRCLAFTPAFAEYRRACDAIGAVFTGVPLGVDDQFKINIPRCVQLLRMQRPELLILNNPHNPSGSLILASEIRVILDVAIETGTKVLIDEAFIDYAPEDQVTAEASTRPGVIAIRSLTKFYGCPGLRIGYAVAHSSTAKQIERQMPAWPIGSIALETLSIAVQDREYARITIAENAHCRTSLADSLVELGFSTYPSAANFLLVRLPPNHLDSTHVREQLLVRHHILVRDCVSFEGLQDGRHIRLAVLTADRNRLLIEALSEVGSCGR
ncbi:MAG TPA: aminotransferase class I/II-fold pyridoxal phosphate-dependent enzyme [Bryobacteraceae bacterium]|nr:aminotransferase class I/II-fold pyridoxal phosphate-dependent enzyme [Bryobacteraceae bacterium]